jgi:hypothetical protein
MDPGSGINIPDDISGCVETIFVKKYLNSLLQIQGLFLNPKLGILDGNMRLWDKHPGSATLTLLDSDPLNARVNNHT